VAVAIVTVVGLGGRIQKLTLTAQTQVGALAAGVARAIPGVRTIRAAGATDREIDELSVLAGDALPARLQGSDGGTSAWAAMLKLWNSGADASLASKCPPAIEAGLYCLRGTATLDKLFAQGRPALLHLRTKNGISDWALLLGADAVRARVRIGTTTFDVDRVALQQAWTGEYAALWRGPETLAEPTTPDGRGPAVDWVHAHLAPAYTGPAVLDAAMRDAVRAFQQSRGLATDGVIGPETLLALGAQDPGPRLKTQLH